MSNTITNNKHNKEHRKSQTRNESGAFYGMGAWLNGPYAKGRLNALNIERACFTETIVR